MRAFLCAALFTTAAAAQPANERYTARGTEPFWSLAIAKGRMTFEHLGVTRKISVKRPRPVLDRANNGRRYVTRALTVDITPKTCSDGMSDALFSDTVQVRAKGQVYRGCGGAPLAPGDLDGTRWRIESIDGKPLAGPRPATLAFEGGRVSGTTGCNRLNGGFEQEGGPFRLGPLATTRMACPGAAGVQERLVLGALTNASGFAAEGAATIELTAPGGRSAVLRRM